MNKSNTTRGVLMSILGCFGLGAEKIISANNFTDGTVTEVKACRWMKINKTPVRAHSLDGAVFPHIIHFTYSVDGTVYKGSRYVNWCAQCPQVKARITVYFDEVNPANYAVKI